MSLDRNSSGNNDRRDGFGHQAIPPFNPNAPRFTVARSVEDHMVDMELEGYVRALEAVLMELGFTWNEVMPPSTTAVDVAPTRDTIIAQAEATLKDELARVAFINLSSMDLSIQKRIEYVKTIFREELCRRKALYTTNEEVRQSIGILLQGGNTLSPSRLSSGPFGFGRKVG